MPRTSKAKVEPKFIVEHFSISNYATQEVNGSFTVAGLYSDEVFVSQKAKNWPQLYVLLITIPLHLSYKSRMIASDPNGEKLITFHMGYSKDDAIDGRERLALCLPLPQFPFHGPRQYVFTVEDDDLTYLTRKYAFITNPGSDVSNGVLDLDVEVHRDGSTRNMKVR